MSDVIGSLVKMQSDCAAPQTPSLLEPRHGASSSSAPIIRHRKTSSGVLNFKMDELMAFPVEALPPGEDVDLTAHQQSSKLLAQTWMNGDVDNALSLGPTSYPVGARNVSDMECDDAASGASISWPPTPSCDTNPTISHLSINVVLLIGKGGCRPMVDGDAYDSDQETVIEDDDDASTYLSTTDDEENDPQRLWNINNTLLDDAELMGPWGLDFEEDTFGEICSHPVPDFVGISSEATLMSIPEDTEVWLDKTGNYVSTEEIRLSRSEEDEMETSEEEAEVESVINDDIDDGYVVRSVTVNSREINLCTRPSNGGVTKRHVSHNEAVQAIHEGSCTYCTSHHQQHRPHPFHPPHPSQARHRKQATMSDFSDMPLDDDVQIACELVIPDVAEFVRPSSVKDTTSNDEAKASIGCCATFKRFPTLCRARRRMEALGRALKKHWPAITSAVVPIVLFFSCRGNK